MFRMCMCAAVRALMWRVFHFITLTALPVQPTSTTYNLPSAPSHSSRAQEVEQANDISYVWAVSRTYVLTWFPHRGHESWPVCSTGGGAQKVKRYAVVHSTAEHNRAEQNRAEHNIAEQRRAENIRWECNAFCRIWQWQIWMVHTFAPSSSSRNLLPLWSMRRISSPPLYTANASHRLTHPLRPVPHDSQLPIYFPPILMSPT